MGAGPNTFSWRLSILGELAHQGRKREMKWFKAPDLRQSGWVGWRTGFRLLTSSRCGRVGRHRDAGRYWRRAPHNEEPFRTACRPRRTVGAQPMQEKDEWLSEAACLCRVRHGKQVARPRGRGYGFTEKRPRRLFQTPRSLSEKKARGTQYAYWTRGPSALY